MEIQHISILTNTIIAISAVFGVIGALTYYMKQIGELSNGLIFLTILFYISLTTLITLSIIESIIKWQTKKKTGLKEIGE